MKCNIWSNTNHKVPKEPVPAPVPTPSVHMSSQKSTEPFDIPSGILTGTQSLDHYDEPLDIPYMNTSTTHNLVPLAKTLGLTPTSPKATTTCIFACTTSSTLATPLIEIFSTTIQSQINMLQSNTFNEYSLQHPFNVHHIQSGMDTSLPIIDSKSECII